MTNIDPGETINGLIAQFGWSPWMQLFPPNEPLYEMQVAYDSISHRVFVTGIINGEPVEIRSSLYRNI